MKGNPRRANRIISPDPFVKTEPPTAMPSATRETAMTVVADWIALRPEFRRDEENKLFPPENQTDGAYGARLVLNLEMAHDLR